MKTFRLFLSCQLIYILIPVLSLTGCLSTQSRDIRIAETQDEAEYVSEVDIPEAKSTFAYGQYRLFAAEGRWEEALEALERAVAFDADSQYLQMNLAKAYLHTKQPEKAIQMLQVLLSQYPDYAQGHELIGDLYLSQNQPADAVGHYRLALEQPPQADSLRLKLAMGLARQDDFPAAIDEVTSLLVDKPDSLSARLALARFYREDKQFSKAVQIYQELLELKPDQMQILVELGQLLEQQGQVEEALELYRSGIDQEPRTVVVRDQMSRLLVTENRYAEALLLLQELNELHPNKIQVLGRIGMLQLELARWTEAELTFRKILRIESDHDRSRYYLGMALSGSGDVVAALQELAAVGEESPVYLDALTQQAYLHQINGRAQEAIKLLEREIESGRDEPILYYYLSSSYVSLDQLTKAEKVLLGAIELHPDNVNLNYQLGVVYEKMEQRDDARRVMVRILEIDPDHADALNYLAYLKAEQGEDLEQALQEAKRALSTKEEGYILDTLGWIYFKLGRYEEGRQPLEKASQMQPDDLVVLEHLGDLYQALGLWSQAADAYRQILELDPLAEGISEKLEALPEGKAQ